MRTLLPAVTDLKNQLAVSGAWLTLMDIVDSSTVKHRYVNDMSDLLYPTDGNTYSAASFQVQQISEEVQMTLPKITVNIYDPELNLMDELQDNAGMSGWTIVLRRVYKTIAGVVTDVDIRQEFTILDVAMADTVISLSIGIADPLARRFPRDNYGALTCRHKFKYGFCRYQLPSNPILLLIALGLGLNKCTHTLEDAPDGTKGCRSHNNSHQFGGSPGAAEGIFYNR